jgi:hypothetical protein
MASYVNTQPGSITHSNFGPAPGSNEGVQGPVTIRTMRNDSTDCAFVANLGVEAFRDKFIHATSVNRYGMIYFRDRFCNLNFFYPDIVLLKIEEGGNCKSCIVSSGF